MSHYDNEEQAVIDQQAEKYLMAEAQLGIEADNFFQTDIGRYLKGQALLEVRFAIETFLRHDVRRNEELIAKAQSDMRRARENFRWLVEQIQRGSQAEYQLDEMGALDDPA